MAIEGKRRRHDEGNPRHNPPLDRQRGGGEEQRKATTNTKWKLALLRVPRGGGSAQLKMHNKEIEQKNNKIEMTQSCATVRVAKFPWPPPGSRRRKASAGREKI